MATWIMFGLRWSARITGLLLFAMVVWFAVAQGPPNPFEQPLPVQMEFLGMGLMLLGFLVGWWCEWLGGLLVFMGFGVFAATEGVVNGQPPRRAIPLFAVPGVLFLLSSGARVVLMATKV